LLWWRPKVKWAPVEDFIAIQLEKEKKEKEKKKREEKGKDKPAEEEEEKGDKKRKAVPSPVKASKKGKKTESKDKEEEEIITSKDKEEEESGTFTGEGFQEGKEDGEQGQRGRGDHYISNYKIYEEGRSGQCEGKCDRAEEGSNGGSQELQGIVGMAVPLVVGIIYIERGVIVYIYIYIYISINKYNIIN
jgi:hypothetical protein